MKKIVLIIFAAVLGGFISLSSYKFIEKDSGAVAKSYSKNPLKYSFTAGDSINNVFSVGFGDAAERTLDQVVHIKATGVMKRADMQQLPNPFRDFFGDDFFDRHFYGPQQRHEMIQSAGSGVIVSSDGYIVTNNHVIDNAEEVKVSLHNGKEFTAKVVGTDPSTDLALVKIEETNLPAATFANSDQVRVGDWVLAVGNPFNLSSTVTTGIVSAKARNINILRSRDNSAIESFIQTDAAVNPGNSGGALVNLKGELIGINTAIATPTGTFAGYSFAVPSNIVAKVVEDFIQHGAVQRAYLGAFIKDLTWDEAKEMGLNKVEGVLIDSLMKNGAAETSGIKPKDVVLKIDENKIRTSAELLENIARHRPGDEINVTVWRSGKEKDLKVKLKNKSGDESVVKVEKAGIIENLGAEFQEVPAQELKKLGLEGGVKVVKMHNGKLSRYTDIREGFIITKVDNKPVKSINDLKKNLEGKNGGILLEGVYTNAPGKYYYGLELES